MIILHWNIAMLFLLAFILATACTVEGLSTNSQLTNDLKQFNMNRHHRTNPKGKGLARNYIRDTFSLLGLHTWTEKFEPTARRTGKIGANIVAVLPGIRYKTKRDRVILIGAHYDTMPYTKGVDDNGSGVAAMLQVARQLTRTSSSCSRTYSVMFVAFDFEEWENPAQQPQVACSELGCGSRAFVKNISNYWDLLPNMSPAKYGQLQGAIIMDTMMNYDSDPWSQDVPQQLINIFPEQYYSIVRNEKRGDFLLVTGRYTDDVALLNTFVSFYNVKVNEQDYKYKLQAFPLPFDGPESKLSPPIRNELRYFLRSDHVSFWNEITSNRAIFLTDTGEGRGYMRKCYHNDCDNLINALTIDKLGFLSKSCDTIVMTTKYLTRTTCKIRKYSAQEGGLKAGEGGAIGVAATICVAASSIAAVVCCRRRKQEDESDLVENDQMEDGMTAVTSQAEAPEHQAPVEA